MSRLYRLIASLVALLGLLTMGCVSYDKQIATYRRALELGDIPQAKEAIDELVSDYAEDETTRNALLLYLEAASVYRLAGLQTNDATLLRESQRYFEAAERRYTAEQQKAKVSLSAEGLSLVTNPTTLPYRGTGYDAVMLNLYQSLNLLQLGAAADARQPLVRAYYHQVENVEANATRIVKAQEAARKDRNAAGIAQATAAARRATHTPLATLPDSTGYENYINPYADYLSGFYHATLGVDASDREMARQRLEKALSLAPDNQTLHRLLADVQQTGTVKPGVYLIHESGLAPYCREKSFFLPIFTGRTLGSVALAFPQLTMDANYTAAAALRDPRKKTITHTEKLCSVDAVISQEYRNEYPITLTRLIASATAKAVAGYLANYHAERSGNDLLHLATLLTTTLYQYGTMTADTRIWTSLPKEVSIARMDIPAERIVDVLVGGHHYQSFILPEPGDIWVIYARSFHHGAPPVISAFRVR